VRASWNNLPVDAARCKTRCAFCKRELGYWFELNGFWLFDKGHRIVGVRFGEFGKDFCTDCWREMNNSGSLAEGVLLNEAQ